MTAPALEPFVPLTTAAPLAGQNAAPRVTLLSDAQAATVAFQPLTTTSPTAAPGHSPAPAAGHQPQITLHREGDRITGIHIQCSCGQVMDLVCSYPNAG